LRINLGLKNVSSKSIKLSNSLQSIYELKRIKFYKTKTESFVKACLKFIEKQHKLFSTIKLADYIVYIKTKDRLLHRSLKHFISLKIALDKLTYLEISVGKKTGLIRSIKKENL
jgi:hypothetical protein